MYFVRPRLFLNHSKTTSFRKLVIEVFFVFLSEKYQPSQTLFRIELIAVGGRLFRRPSEPTAATAAKTYVIIATVEVISAFMVTDC